MHGQTEFNHLTEALVEALLGEQVAPASSDLSDHALSRDQSHNGACTNGAYCTHKTSDPQHNNINKVTNSGRLSDVTHTAGHQVDGLAIKSTDW